MKIFLDDYRTASEGYYQVWNYEDCVMLLNAYKLEISFISLDYDLGTGKETGYDILVYMKENGIKPQGINVHSDHYDGVNKMRDYAAKNFEYLETTFNKVRY